MADKRESLIKNGVISEIEKTLFILDKKIKDNYALILKDYTDFIINMLKNILKIQNEGNIGKIDIILFTFSRLYIDNESYIYPVLVYDETMDIAEYNKISSIDVSFLYESLNEIKQKVYNNHKKYIRENITIPEIERELYKYLKYFNMYFVNILRDVFNDKEVKDLIKDIKKADIFAVIQGELLEKPYCICEYKNEKSV